MPETSSEPSAEQTFVEQELATQPAVWRAAVAAAPDHAASLPGTGERVAVVGCGTSLFMSRAYAALREAAGHGETDAFAASEYPHNRRYDRVVGLSRSGTTTELVDAVTRIAGSGTPVTVLTVDPETPLAVDGVSIVDLPYASERSVVQTRFPTAALAMLRTALGEDLAAVVAAGEVAVGAPLPLDAAGFAQFTFLGRGWAAAIADEAALKCREAAGAWTESYPAMEYRHGPISVSGSGTVVWVFGDVPDGLEADAIATGATFVNHPVDPMADLIRAQRLAVGLAAVNGRDPDNPQSLSFSVVLP